MQIILLNDIIILILFFELNISEVFYLVSNTLQFPTFVFPQNFKFFLFFFLKKKKDE